MMCLIVLLFNEQLKTRKSNLSIIYSKRIYKFKNSVKKYCFHKKEIAKQKI